MTDYEMMIIKSSITVAIVAVIALAIGTCAVLLANKLIDRWDKNRPKLNEQEWRNEHM